MVDDLQIFAELPPLIRESDLQISQLSLRCITGSISCIVEH